MAGFTGDIRYRPAELEVVLGITSDPRIVLYDPEIDFTTASTESSFPAPE